MSVVLAFGATVLLGGATNPPIPAVIPVAADTSAAQLFLHARAELRRGEAATGLTDYIRAADRASSPADWDLFAGDMAWIATPAEMAAWRKAPAAERPALVRSFWAGRDARDGLAPGERLVTHVQRLDYAMSHYRIHPKHGKAPVMRASRVGDSGPLATLVGVASPLRDFIPTQGELDDRGVIYVRQGEPSSIIYSAGLGVESWTYQRDDQPVTVHFAESLFDGSSGNGMLIASPPLAVFEGVCQVDQAYCGAAARGASMPPEQRERVRQVALAAIKRLTTVDSAAAPETVEGR